MKARSFLLLVPVLLALMVACGGPYDLEPAAESGAPVDPGRPDGTPTPAPSATPTPTLIVRPAATGAAPAYTTPTVTPGPRPTSTPVPPFPGFIYRNEKGLWQVGVDWQPVHVSPRPDAKVSPDGQRVLYIENGDVFVQNMEGGEAVNVTASSNWEHLHAQWWPARPETLVLMSRKQGAAEPNEGYLTLATVDGSDHRVVGNSASYALPAPGPDGQTIAYDEEGTAMLYHLEGGPEPFEPAAYGLPDGVTVSRIASPAWSPDGGRLAWMMAVEGGD